MRSLRGVDFLRNGCEIGILSDVCRNGNRPFPLIRQDLPDIFESRLLQAFAQDFGTSRSNDTIHANCDLLPLFAGKGNT